MSAFLQESERKIMSDKEQLIACIESKTPEKLKEWLLDYAKNFIEEKDIKKIEQFEDKEQKSLIIDFYFNFMMYDDSKSLYSDS